MISEEIMRLKKQQFDETIKQCKQHQQELQLVRDEMKEKDDILQKERFLSQFFENQTNEKFAENEILFKTTNILNNEKEILLAKLENQFTINTNNETTTQGAINKALSITDSFHKEVEEIMYTKNLQSQCRDDVVNKKTDLEKYSKHFKDVKNNAIHGDLIKHVSVREPLETLMESQQSIIFQKLTFLEKILLNCDHQLKSFQATIPTITFKYNNEVVKVRIILLFSSKFFSIV